MKKKNIFHLLTIATAIGAGGWILHQKFWTKKRYYGELSKTETSYVRGKCYHTFFEKI